MLARVGRMLLALTIVCARVAVGWAASGDLDPGLLGGRAHTDFDGYFDQAEAVVVQPDGTVVAGGLARRKIGETQSGIPLFRAELALVRYTAAGVRDTAFGTAGRVRTDFGEDVDVRTLVRDPTTGDLIAVGHTPSFPQKVVFARYHADGTPDARVGGGSGRVVTTIPGFAYAALAQADGTVLVGGSGRNTSGFDAFLLARLNGDGTPDLGFDGDGYVISNLGAAIRGLVAVPGGKVVAAGWVHSGSLSGYRNFVVARFSDAGAPDLGFGPSGTGATTIDFFNSPSGDEGRAVARTPAGALVIGGFAYEGTGAAADRHFALARLTEGGILDGGFGGTGKVTTPLPDEGMVRAIFVQSSGKILAVGEAGKGIDSSTLASTRPNVALARYGTDGMLDAAFGDGGTIVHQLRGAETPRAAAMQGDDKPVVVGRSRDDWLVLRLVASGQADPTFGAGGRVLLRGESGEQLQGFGGALQSDGKILVAGRGLCTSGCSGFFDADMAVTRHLPDGRLDATFGDGGLAMPNFPGLQVAARVAVQVDHQVVAAGASATATGVNDDFALVRLTGAGVIDPSFGSGGLATTDFFGADDRVGALAVQSVDQKLVLAGQAETGGRTLVALARFLPTGALDPGFGTGGKVTIDIAGKNSRALGMLVQPDGKIVAVGETADDATGAVAIVRRLANGAPDPGFGTNGVVVTDLTANGDGGTDVLRLANGRLVVAGYADYGGDEDFVVARYLENGTLDGTFGQGGFVRTDLFGFHGPDEAIAIAAEADGKLLALGDTKLYRTYDFAVARYGAEGATDGMFGAGGQMLVDLFETEDFDPRSALVQTDGRLVGVGTSDGMGFFRMEMAGGPQPTFPPTPTTSTTTSTRPGVSTTTTTLGSGGTSSTTVAGGSTTSTTLAGGAPPLTPSGTAEVCGNCLDDDANGRTDFDDPVCCGAAGAAQLLRADLRGGAGGGRLKLQARLSGGGLPGVDATMEDLFVRVSSEDGATLLCGRIPARAFQRKKKVFRFVDRARTIAEAAGVDRVVVKPRRTESVLVTLQGKQARVAAGRAGAVRVTLAFDVAGGSPGQCASVVKPFRALPRNKGIRFP